MGEGKSKATSTPSFDMGRTQQCSMLLQLLVIITLGLLLHPKMNKSVLK